MGFPIVEKLVAVLPHRVKDTSVSDLSTKIISLLTSSLPALEIRVVSSLWDLHTPITSTLVSLSAAARSAILAKL